MFLEAWSPIEYTEMPDCKSLISLPPFLILFGMGGVVVPPGCISPVLSSFGCIRPSQEEAMGDGGKVK